jgi:dethiobiotin synthetase
MNGFFVTGTDTNVGKTVLSALLVAALDGIYWKPVQTGAIEGTDQNSIGLWAACPEERILPERYLFDPPVSPHLAASEAGIRIALEDFALPAPLDGHPLVVEGAGGAMVPLNEKDLMLDLMRLLGLPVIVAARTSLGTINHTLLTLRALREAHLNVHGVVMIGEKDVENRRAIEHYGKARVVGDIPVLQEISRSALLEVFVRHFDRQAFPRP